MSKSFTWREKQVLFHIVKNPDYADRSIADKTGLKLSTVTAIRRRLKEKGFFNVIRLPWLHELGAELLAVNYSVYKATSPQELRIKTSKKFARLPLVANILEPLITHSSPSLTAVVVAHVTSQPASGSVIAVPIIASPATN